MGDTEVGSGGSNSKKQAMEKIEQNTKSETPTPRSDAEEGEAYIGVVSFDGADICKAYDFARTLERELNEAKEWQTAALTVRYCSAEIDVSTAEKYKTAEAVAKCRFMDGVAELRTQLTTALKERDEARARLNHPVHSCISAEKLEKENNKE